MTRRSGLLLCAAITGLGLVRAAWPATIVINPLAPDTVYVVHADAVYKSADAGAHWKRASIGMPVSTDSTFYVKEIAMSPRDPETLFAGVMAFDGDEGDSWFEGVWRTTDGAVTWSRPSRQPNGGAMGDIAVSPLNPNVVYVSADDGIAKSVDGGTTWTWMNGLGTFAWSLALSPTDSDLLYAGTMASGLFRSTDGGVSWSAPGAGLPDRHIRSLAVDPAHPSTLYAGTRFRSVYRSSSGGSVWNAANGHLRTASVYALEIDPLRTATLFAGTRLGLFRSDDSGKRWIKRDQGIADPWIEGVAFDPRNTGVAWAVTHDGAVYRTSSQGDSWRQMLVPTASSFH